MGSLHLAQVPLLLLASHDHHHVVSFLRSRRYNHIQCYVWAERSTRLEQEGYDQVASLVECEASA